MTVRNPFRMTVRIVRMPTWWTVRWQLKALLHGINFYIVIPPSKHDYKEILMLLSSVFAFVHVLNQKGKYMEKYPKTKKFVFKL